MAENKMAQVAALFGKKLNEKFKLRMSGYAEDYDAHFTAKGLVVTYFNYPDALFELLIGKAVIVDD